MLSKKYESNSYMLSLFQKRKNKSVINLRDWPGRNQPNFVTIHEPKQSKQSKKTKTHVSKNIKTQKISSSKIQQPLTIIDQSPKSQTLKLQTINIISQKNNVNYVELEKAIVSQRKVKRNIRIRSHHLKINNEQQINGFNTDKNKIVIKKKSIKKHGQQEKQYCVFNFLDKLKQNPERWQKLKGKKKKDQIFQRYF